MEWVQDTYDPILSGLIAIPIRCLCSFDLWHATPPWGVKMHSQLSLKNWIPNQKKKRGENYTILVTTFWSHNHFGRGQFGHCYF